MRLTLTAALLALLAAHAHAQTSSLIAPETNVVCATPTVTQGAYTAGEEVGGLVTLSNALGAKHTGIIQAVTINFHDVQTAEFDVSLFDQLPSNSTWTDHAVPSINNSDEFAVLPLLQIVNAKSVLGSHTVMGLSGLGLPISTGSTSLWLVVTTPGAPTLAATNDMQVCVSILAD